MDIFTIKSNFKFAFLSEFWHSWAQDKKIFYKNNWRINGPFLPRLFRALLCFVVFTLFQLSCSLIHISSWHSNSKYFGDLGGGWNFKEQSPVYNEQIFLNWQKFTLYADLLAMFITCSITYGSKGRELYTHSQFEMNTRYVNWIQNI
jgi:hypothetical protein